MTANDEGCVAASPHHLRSITREVDVAILVSLILGATAICEDRRPFDITVSSSLHKTEPAEAVVGETLQRRFDAICPECRQRPHQGSDQTQRIDRAQRPMRLHPNKGSVAAVRRT